MKRTISVFLVGALGVSAFARDANSEFRAFLMAELPRITNAFSHKDSSYFEKISAPDFTAVEAGRTTNRKDSIAQMKAEFASVKTMAGHVTLGKTAVVGKVGVANTTGRFTMTMKPDKTGKSHIYVMDMWEKETWVKTSAGWKMQKLEEVKPPHVMLDGKPFSQSGMGH